MRLLSTVFATLGVCALTFAQVPASPAHAPAGIDKANIEAYLRQVELLPAQLQIKVGDPKPSVLPNYLDLPVEVVTPNGVYALHYFLSSDGRYLVKGNMFDITKPPFESERKGLKTAGQPNFGPAGAPVTLVVFSDFQCPNCKEEAKLIHENIPKTFPNDVHVFFKDFPLETMHPWAKPAAIAGRCVFNDQPAAFWDYHDWVYEHQTEITAENLKQKVLGWAETKKVDTAKLGQCMDTKATEKDVDRSVAEGRSLGVSGTPTMFINGRPFTGALAWQNLEAVIKLEVEYAKKSAKDEKCCEVTIPSLAK
jgi:protein-disulfide isomerase